MPFKNNYGMTCIVGCIDKENENVIMGADQMAASELQIWDRKDKKIWRKNGFVIGGSGSYRLIQILMYNFSPSKPLKNMHRYMCNQFIDGILQVMKEKDIDEDVNLLVGYKHQLFTIHSDFQVFETESGFDAIGSGSDYAIGSMFTSVNFNLPTKERVKLALEASAANCPTVGKPFNFIET